MAEGLAGKENDTNERLNRLDGPDGNFGTRSSLSNRVVENSWNDVKASNENAVKSLPDGVLGAVDVVTRMFRGSK
jgi:hypothetical protein